jgi:hypothetical protein
MGIDSPLAGNAVFVSAVFSRVAFVVTLSQFAHALPPSFSLYRLAPESGAPGWQAKLFYPRVSFATCSDAVRANQGFSAQVAAMHDRLALSTMRRR